jgi:hypothetical protein
LHQSIVMHTARLIILGAWVIAVACDTDHSFLKMRDGGGANTAGGSGSGGAMATGGGTGRGGASAPGGRGATGGTAATGGVTAQGGTFGAGGTSAGDQALCLSGGGTVIRQLCCGTAAGGDFPNTCAIGGCGCAPDGSHEVATCSCPVDRCFLPGTGCAVCAPGDDHACSDDRTVTSIQGTCSPRGTCTCSAGFALNPATGRCR